ncbi:NADH-quinone oxidoreductase subunit NuoF [Parabacteroides sp. FAFU027]|uniref:NADH-quinone oxidoreductase subunit NuoF n=1 Tax=Parabacteroides sp. FAFU027 TaxID=2922715 RepID=UPI001FAFB7D2|nr:NADH-quinone oxidoreductase subunit NuoF [Parabacteroides sp. FAFU027]
MERKIILEHIDVKGIRSIEVYRSMGGYDSVAKALKSMTPDEVTEQVINSGLRGRGGAGFPTGRKWSFIDKKSNNPRYLICNADESEPGTFKDRYLMEHIPHRLIEGMISASYALGANTAYIYVRGEFKYIIGILNQSIKEAYQQGFLGKNILDSGFDLDIYVHPGAGAYICGEETALIESLEGKRGTPRLKPPFPAIKGLYDCPTVVNNVETLANIGWIVNNGAESYAQIGIGNSKGTKLISACGNINKPGVYEIEMGLPVETFIYNEKFCGGIKNGKDLKAVIPGGSSVPILPKELILKTADGKKRLLSYESLSEGGFQTGSMLGSGGFIVYNENACIVRNTYNLSRFYHHESCGQCSPCREGTSWMEAVLHRIEHGHGKQKDIDLLVEIASRIEGNTICPLGDAAAWPVAAAIRHFRHEFEFHVEHPEIVKNIRHGSLAKYAK